jgi:biopolymer transport protein ExbB
MTRSPIRLRWLQLAAILLACALVGNMPALISRAQDGGPSAAENAPLTDETPTDEANPAPAQDENSLSLWRLYSQGGFFMIPITLLSILTVVMAIERSFALRRERVLPGQMVTTLGQLSTSPGGFDPRKAFRICQQYPSAASRVVRTMLLKVGRPISEIEHAVSEASNREASRLYANVRWLNLAATIAPLLGLLGTVQGMILAFHKMTTLAPGQDKATELASGIYVALVTTFAGLCVAIPAAIFSHWFEGKIQTLFHETDELVFSLLPQVERYENRVRFSHQQADNDTVEPPASPASVVGAAGK